MATTPTASVRKLATPAKAVEAYRSSEKGGKETCWETVDKYLPLVKSIVGKMRIYFPEEYEIRDIYSIALHGLIGAVQNFDTSKSNAFGSYAKIRIRGALLDELRRMDTLTRDQRVSAKQFQKSVAELEQELKREVTDEDICKKLGISIQECRYLRHLHSPTHMPLDSPFLGNPGEGFAMHELISDPTEQDAREMAESRDIVELVKESLGLLDGMQEKVLALYYLEGLKLSDIADVLDLTESRICQIHTKAISLLRKIVLEKLKH